MQPLEQLDDEALTAALRASRCLEDAPEAAIQRAIASWPAAPRAAVATPAGGAWSRLRAVLAFDSAAQDRLALGLRGGASLQGEPVRQWLFTAGEHDIDLRASPSARPRLWALSGQILGPQRTGSVTLRRLPAEGDVEGDAGADAGARSADFEDAADAADAAPAQTVAWNEWSEFHFDALEPGQYLLCLRSDEGELELPPVPVGL
jgi:hypothetical protein